MSSGVAVLITLVGLALALRFLPGRGGPREGWSWRLDLPPMLLVLVLVTLAQQLLLADAALPLGGVASSDFTEYCGSMAAWAQGQESFYTWNRSRLHAILWSGFVAERGVIDTLLLNAAVGGVLITLGLYLWGRALHSTLAGAAAALFGAAMTPLLMQARSMTFYPLNVAAFTLSAALCCLALRVPTPFAFFLAGCGSAFALLADLRGLIWAVPCLGLAGLAAVAGWRRWSWTGTALRLTLLLLPMWGSWFAARETYSAQTVSLEDQLHVNQRLRELNLFDAVDESLYESRTSFVWGWTPLSDIPASLHYLSKEGQLVPKPDESRSFWESNYRRHLAGWMLSSALAFGLALLGLRRRLLLIMGLGGTMLPFMVTLRPGVMLLFAQPRFLAQGIPALAMVLGVGFAVGVGAALGAPEAKGRWPILRETIAFSALFALVLGLWPEPIGPHAAWRGKPLVPEGYEELMCILREAEHGALSCPVLQGPSTRLCTQALFQAHQAGIGPRAEALWAAAEAGATLGAETP